MKRLLWVVLLSIFCISCSDTMGESMLDKDFEEGQWNKTRWNKAKFKK